MKNNSTISAIQKMLFKSGIAFFTLMLLLATSILSHANSVQAVKPTIVILSHYNYTLKIGQSFYLSGLAINGKYVTWKSSSSRIASVNTYGKVTAKKAGSCNITGKVSGGEASCRITVQKTSVTLSATSITLENGASAVLKGSTSNGSSITWKSQKSSVATIDGQGRITARKPGETTVTASADGTKKTCRITVRKPTVTLNRTSATLYRGQAIALVAKVSSGKKVTWKSRKTSVATVDSSGNVMAKKHGTACIQAKVDGVIKECEIIVRPPVIRLSKTSATLRKGGKLTLKATVSSGNAPRWKSSKSSVASVDQNGNVTARTKGSCYISVTEDGTTEKCHIQVTAK